VPFDVWVKASQVRRKETVMRFMVIIKANEKSEAGVLPSEQALNEMTTYNEELVKAGVMLAGEGLQASSKGARVRFSGSGETTVIDGPFAETKELVAGFWILQCKSKDEVIEWVKRIPNTDKEDFEVEIRQVFETEDFPEGEWTDREVALQEQIAKNN
jgi:hypothetical protein